jgi:hypothetical protein
VVSSAESETLFRYFLAGQHKIPDAFSPPTSAGLSFMQMFQTQQPSWWGTFFSSFFSPAEMIKTTYHSFADEGGCDKLMYDTIAEDLLPIPDKLGIRDVTDNADVAAYAGALARAGAYSASRGLTVPLRSSIFRSLRGDAVEGMEILGSTLPRR